MLPLTRSCAEPQQTNLEGSSGLFSQLEDLDFADDLAILSYKQSHLQEKTTRLHNIAKPTGLNISTINTQVMCINQTVHTPITVDGGPFEMVEEFNYLGRLDSTDNAASKGINARLGKAFARFRPIWKSKQYSLRTKIGLYYRNVKLVLLYGEWCRAI